VSTVQKVAARPSVDDAASGGVAYQDQPSKSPWIAQLAPDASPRPLDRDGRTGVVIVGAGIAGVASAFFTLRETDKRVLLVERDRVGRGATGRNGGQLTTYFERPLFDIADEHGVKLAAEAQRSFDNAHDLLDELVAESGAPVRVERFTGHMGMFNLHQVLVHLRSNQVRRKGGLRLETCVLSEQAEFVSQIPPEFAGLYSVVPQARIREMLETRDDRYQAVLSGGKGCANGGALVQQVLAYMEMRYPDRFQFVDHTGVNRVVIAADEAVIHARGLSVTASQVVLCTNGYVDHDVQDQSGKPIRLAANQRINGRVAYMTAFVDQPRPPAAMSYIRNATIGGDTAYVYITRRTYDRVDDAVTLTCMGGPEYPSQNETYDPETPFPGTMLDAMDEEVRPFAQPSRPPGMPYDFQWHGLMGYNDSGIRVVGAHPTHPRLYYNLGCNGVGFLPSVYGGQRVARLLAGERLPPSIFDPAADAKADGAL
jgi:glycine/D-amino acid oxidase-like deaminating enzyme